MNFFHRIEGEVIILRNKGVFKQVDIYYRSGELFAKHGQGFIRLNSNMTTTHPDVFVDEMNPAIVSPLKGPHGRMMIESAAMEVIEHASVTT